MKKNKTEKEIFTILTSGLEQSRFLVLHTLLQNNAGGKKRAREQGEKKRKKKETILDKDYSQGKHFQNIIQIPSEGDSHTKIIIHHFFFLSSLFFSFLSKSIEKKLRKVSVKVLGEKNVGERSQEPFQTTD